MTRGSPFQRRFSIYFVDDLILPGGGEVGVGGWVTVICSPYVGFDQASTVYPPKLSGI